MGRSKAWRRYVANPDPKSQALIDKLRVAWSEVKLRPPAKREQWLRSSEGIVALGAQVCNQLLKDIDRQRKRMAKIVPTSTWLDAFYEGGVEFPAPEVNPIRRLRCPADRPRLMSLAKLAAMSGIDRDLLRDFERSISRPTVEQCEAIARVLGGDGQELYRRIMKTPLSRRFGGRMQLSREETRIGMDGVAHRRWTPDIAVRVEDRLDELTSVEAIYYDYPASPSAKAIQAIEMTKATEVGWRMHLRILGQ